ncbi:MAG: hypothetical protein JRI75_09495 [Deltaproteobacteria bacterium]|nr:hypothetical protein [Deltaproteobacteria bacterium]
MAKREKVILILMVLTILGGGYIYFFSSPQDADIGIPVKDPDVLNRFVADVVGSLRSSEPTKNDRFVLARAASEWKKDPFLPAELNVTSEVSIDEDKVIAGDINFTYSGYIDMGNRKLAIINGMEYETGEALEQGVYILKRISPIQVVIGVAGGLQEVTLPLEEMD